MTFTTRPTLSGTFGMVSSTHWLASQVGMRMLELGGNAADAAVAAGLVLQVVEPHLNGPGGDLPVVIAAPGEEPQVLCGQGPAPAGATPEHFAAAGLDRVPGSGPLAAVVPGAVDAWLVLLRDRGTMRLAEVAAPALHYARHGHPLLAAVTRTIDTVADLFDEDWTTSAAQWRPGGRTHRPGELVANPAWADTLERLVAQEQGVSREAGIDAVRRAWSHGFVAEAIDAFARRPFRHSGGQVLPGVLSADDLASWEATWEPAVTHDWAGVRVAKTGPWGQGPALLQVLAQVGELDVDSVEGVHQHVEAWKLAMADREAWYGDSAEVPLADLLDPGYAAARRALVGPTASHELRPGSPGGRVPRLAAQALETASPDLTGDATAGEPTVRRDGVTRGDTCHVAVVDADGLMVSATPSGGWLQSSPLVPEIGLALGSRLQMSWLEQGLPGSLVPGRRPRTTLTPTLVLRDGIPVLACGSPGGDQQDQWQSILLLRHLVGGRSLQEAIDAPMWHTTSFPGSFYPRATEPGVLVAESRLPGLDELRSRGHRVVEQGPWSLGRLCVVSRDPGTGVLSAAANPRGMQGYAVGR